MKSALSIEMHVGPLEDDLLTALRLQRWRTRVEVALKPNSKYTGISQSLPPFPPLPPSEILLGVLLCDLPCTMDHVGKL